MAMLSAHHSGAAQGLMVTGADRGDKHKRGEVKLVSRNFSVATMLRQSIL
jgi:hypothetical protein